MDKNVVFDRRAEGFLMEYDLSIVVPVYNTEQYLEQCLQSIFNQTISNFEVIIVNDGSTDHSLKIIKKFETNYTNIKVINKKNEGTLYCKLDGMRAATGKYIGFVDSDDYIEPDMYKRMLQTAIDKNVDICECMFIPEIVDNNTRKRLTQIKLDNAIGNRLTEKKISTDKVLNYYYRGKGIKVYMWSRIFRRNCIERSIAAIDKYDKGEKKFLNIYADDSFFTPLFFIMSQNCYILKERYYHYRVMAVGSLNRRLAETLEKKAIAHGKHALMSLIFIESVLKENHGLYHKVFGGIQYKYLDIYRTMFELSYYTEGHKHKYMGYCKKACTKRIVMEKWNRAMKYITKKENRNMSDYEKTIFFALLFS